MLTPIRICSVAIVMSASIAGCGKDPEIRQYVVEAENERGLTSELLRRQFPMIPFHWDVPETWQLASNDQFSVRAWSAGAPPDLARITLGQFPARTGIPAQVERWQRQVGLNTDDPMNNVKAFKTKNGAGSFATIEGAKETILAFILPIDNQFWILRFKGSSSTARAEGDRFRQFCESLEYIAPPGPSGSQAGISKPSSDSPKPQLETEASNPPEETTDSAASEAQSTESTEPKSDETTPSADSSDKGE